MGCKKDRFIPLVKYFEEFESKIEKPKEIKLAFKRGENSIAHVSLTVDLLNLEESKKYVEKNIKCYLYIIGAYRVYFKGPVEIYEYVDKIYSKYGKRQFDYKFMSDVFDNEFKIEYVNNLPEEKLSYIKPQLSLEGNRIGFDAGGSDMKVTVIKDKEVLLSEEVLWEPKLNSDPNYHKKRIKEVFDKAYKLLGSIDSVGISSAGIYIDNEAKIASLFNKIPKDKFKEQIKNIYIDLKDEYKAKRLNVMNDGDISALAGAWELDKSSVLGIAMGTAEAAGYVDKEGNITGYFNELAFVPIAANEDSALDEWSLELGVGAKYLSQDSVIRLADYEGIKLEDDMSLAKKLKTIQKLVDKGDERAIRIFKRVGEYLAHALALYNRFYDIKHVLLLGRVTSYKSGDILIENTKKVLKEQYSEVYSKIQIHLPDESKRRLGQSYIAAMI